MMWARTLPADNSVENFEPLGKWGIYSRVKAEAVHADGERGPFSLTGYFLECHFCFARSRGMKHNFLMVYVKIVVTTLGGVNFRCWGYLCVGSATGVDPSWEEYTITWWLCQGRRHFLRRPVLDSM